tara:strand:- start:8464 stop:8907 length:444 start_codon:yes stop_codon:yes gene_type:complete
MLLSDMLKKFESPKLAAELGRCGRTSAWHWYQEGLKRKVPSVSVLILWSDHFEISDGDLGELIRDANKLRLELQEDLCLLRGELPPRRSELRRKLEEEIAAKYAQELVDAEVNDLEEREQDWARKERVQKLLTLKQQLENINVTGNH